MKKNHIQIHSPKIAKITQSKEVDWFLTIFLINLLKNKGYIIIEIHDNIPRVA